MSERFPIPFGRYLLLERLAIGGMAELFLAQPMGARGNSERVVIKKLLPHMASQAHFKDMFLDEAKLTLRLMHSKIAQTYEFGRHGEQLFIAMEFVDGIDGLALLRECAHRKVRLPAEIAVYTAHEILDALDYAHNQVDENGTPLGVVHRDISPSNVLFSRRGDIKLVDFGIARATQRSHHTKDGTLKGKYGYMSPEQVLDDEVDARSDLFSVGIVLAELLTGRRLFAAPNELDVLLMVRDARLERLDRFGGHIGMDLDRILRKSLRKRADDRFASAAEFRDALSEWLFMHHHMITAHVISEVVDAFYEDAWKRKCGGTPGSFWNKQVQGIPLPMLGPDSDVHESENIEGIPVGRGISDTDSLPVVSIEDFESAPIQSREVSGSIAIPDQEGMQAGDFDWTGTQMTASEASAPGGTQPKSSAMAAGAVAGTRAAGVRAAAAARVAAPGRGELSAPVEITDFVIEDDDPDMRRMSMVEGNAPVAVSGERSMSFPSFDHALDALAPNEGVPAGRAGTASGPHANAAHESRPLGEPDDVGDFAESPPIAVLYRLAVSRASGLLAAAVGGIRKEIFFREGIPEYVSSNVSNELFGAYLVQEGILSSGELSLALAMMPRYENRLGDTLVSLNLLTPLEVLRYLTRQVRQKLIDVCTWSRGTFAWYAGRENPREAFPLDLNAFEVLGAGALALPEEAIAEWLHKIGEIRPRLMADGRVSPESFQLGALMRDVCNALDGSRTMADLRTWFAKQRVHDRFVRVLYLLIQTGLVSPA